MFRDRCHPCSRHQRRCRPLPRAWSTVRLLAAASCCAAWAWCPATAGADGLTLHAGGGAGGLGGVHGMRTPPDQRRRGHAGRLLAAFGRQTAGWGLPGIFLQVEAGNPARRLYRDAGFTELWRYWYWR